MKLEIRKVTVEKAIYIAKDGKEFYDESTCEAHEIELIEKTIEFYDSDFEKSDLESCTYVVLKTSDEIEALKDLCRYFGISHKGITEKTGIYMYVDRGDTWKNISYAVDRIRTGG